MAESISSQRGLIPAGGDKEPGSGGRLCAAGCVAQAARSFFAAVLLHPLA